MNTLSLSQGSPEWHAHRANSYNASDAPAMMGRSPYETRSELIKRLATSITPEVDAATQRRFDEGHRFEALARPLAEKIIGEELYPLVGTDDGASGLSRPISASFDGLTMMGEDGLEHKRLNKELRAVMVDGCTGADLSPLYRIQMESQCIVADTCRRVLFMASEWDSNGNLIEERHCWYTPDPALRAEILAGWKQFDADLAAYVPAPADVVVIPKAASSLPIVFDMRVEGKIVSCNVEQYKPAALAFIAEINTKLTTDQHFADAKADATFCRDSADKLELAIEQALGQMGDINTAINTVREIAAAFDAKGLALEKLVESQTKAIKESHVLRGQAALKAHIDALNTRLGKPYMPTVAADFGTAVKNKRTVESLRNSVDTELARAKIAASEIADRIDTNLKYLREHAENYKGLFADAATIVLKAPDDLQALAKSRIADHKAEIARQAEAAAEQARETIRKEEQAKAEKAAREKLAAEQAEAQRLADEQARQATPPAAPAPEPVRVPVASAPVSAPAANVVPMSRPAAPADTGALVKLGDVNASIAPLSITADGLTSLGFPYVAPQGAAKMYRTADLPAMYAAMVAHIEAAQAKQAA